MWIRTKAIILGSSPIRESDLLLTCFTEKLGKLKAVAKGALRSQKRFLGILLNLNLLEIELVPSPKREEGYLLSLAELRESRFSLSQSPERFASASVLAELVEKASAELSPEPALFHLLQTGISQIQKKKNTRETLFFFLLKILGQLGYMPSLEFCVNCGKKLANQLNHYLFSISKGGLVCKTCQSEMSSSSPKKSLRELPAGLSRALSALQRLKPTQAERILLSKKDFSLGLDLFREFTSWHLKPLASLQFLKEFISSEQGK